MIPISSTATHIHTYRVSQEELIQNIRELLFEETPNLKKIQTKLDQLDLSDPLLESDPIQRKLGELTSLAFCSQKFESIHLRILPYLNEFGVLHAFEYILEIYLKDRVKNLPLLFPYPYRLAGIEQLLEHTKMDSQSLAKILDSEHIYKFPGILWQILNHRLASSALTPFKTEEINEIIQTYENLSTHTLHQIEEQKTKFDTDMEIYPHQREAFKTAYEKMKKTIEQMDNLIPFLQSSIAKHLVIRRPKSH